MAKTDSGKKAKAASVASQKKESEEKMPLFKYFLVVDSSIHVYSRASLEQQYKGIMKTEKEWQKEMKSYEEEGV